MNSALARLIPFVFVLLVALGFTALVDSVEQPFGFGSFGTNDYIEFWSAWQLFSSGANPYDPQLLNEMQRSLGRLQEHALLLWNPPWVLTLLAPLLEFDFAKSSKLFIFLNLLLLGSGSLMLWSAAAERRIGSPKAFAAGLLFLPGLTNLQIGQIGIMLFFCVAGFIWSAQRGKDFLAGLFLVPLSIKVHIVFLFLFAAALWIVRYRRFAVFWGGAAGFLLLLGATLSIAPGALEMWLGGFSSPPFYWKTASLSGALRSLLFALTGDAPIWPIAVLPLAALLGVSWWLLVKRPALDWTRHAAPLIALSLMFSPYGWLFDQTLLLTAQVILSAQAFEKRTAPAVRREILLLLAVVQMFVVAALASGLAMHHHFFWHPLAILWVWLRGQGLLRETAATPDR